MRGRHEEQEVMPAHVDIEGRVPKDHPLRTIKKVADEALPLPRGVVGGHARIHCPDLPRTCPHRLGGAAPVLQRPKERELYTCVPGPACLWCMARTVGVTTQRQNDWAFHQRGGLRCCLLLSFGHP